ncbi:hypothetical protein [Phenylobacterium sp.]|uniref:hypothetical protein n=1 Tax=Phenylobacterium sp. TaxID=1871053 RepID=UPI00273195A1|nr:hypothetical protein [Phenylobacterium sp.]MDP1873624.1 hypothetical protein [Phenylobacterium sp.]
MIPLKYWTYGAVPIALAGVVLWLSWTANSRERAILRAEVAEDQSDLNAGATQTVEHVLRTETFVRTQAEEASHAIAIAPGADAPVPDELLSSWRAGIDGVRQAPAAGSDPGR